MVVSVGSCLCLYFSEESRLIFCKLYILITGILTSFKLTFSIFKLKFLRAANSHLTFRKKEEIASPELMSIYHPLRSVLSSYIGPCLMQANQQMQYLPITAIAWAGRRENNFYIYFLLNSQYPFLLF